MSNLINNLHDMADLLSAEEYSEDAEIIRDAICEIERLRAVVAAQVVTHPVREGKGGERP